jgi:MraZ protein
MYYFLSVFCLFLTCNNSLSCKEKTFFYSLTIGVFFNIVGLSGKKWVIVGVTEMFQGADQLNLDSKGRLAIPARHRDVLLANCAGKLVLTADPDKCLLVYPEFEWQPIRDKLIKLSSFNAKSRALQRVLVGYANAVEMDGTGRVLIPPTLRSYAALDKCVMLVGQGNKFELWDEGKWQARLEADLSFEEGELPPELEGFSL